MNSNRRLCVPPPTKRDHKSDFSWKLACCPIMTARKDHFYTNTLFPILRELCVSRTRRFSRERLCWKCARQRGVREVKGKRVSSNFHGAPVPIDVINDNSTQSQKQNCNLHSKTQHALCLSLITLARDWISIPKVTPRRSDVWANLAPLQFQSTWPHCWSRNSTVSAERVLA